MCLTTFFLASISFLAVKVGNYTYAHIFYLFNKKVGIRSYAPYCVFLTFNQQDYATKLTQMYLIRLTDERGLPHMLLIAS